MVALTWDRLSIWSFTHWLHTGRKMCLILITDIINESSVHADLILNTFLKKTFDKISHDVKHVGHTSEEIPTQLGLQNLLNNHIVAEVTFVNAYPLNGFWI